MRLPGAAAALLAAPGSLANGARRRLTGDYDEDRWGRDPEFADAVQPALDALYDRWWRVEATGTEHVPSTGRALIVANHAGVVPWDALMMATALRRAPAAREARFLVLNWAFELPFAGVVIRRVGGVPASPANAQGLLDDDHAVMVFPEGAKGIGKPFGERYRLARFGRGGFVETALRARAPIVPCAVVGSEEIYPKIAEASLMAKLMRAPYAPITPTFPLLGPLGAVPLPSKWRIAFGEPIVLHHPPEAADDRALVLEIADQVRDAIQRALYENLVLRRGAFL